MALYTKFDILNFLGNMNPQIEEFYNDNGYIEIIIEIDNIYFRKNTLEKILNEFYNTIDIGLIYKIKINEVSLFKKIKLLIKRF